MSTDTDTLTLDEDKLKKALEENPESVRAILAGEGGVLTMMEDSVEQSLKSSVGYFDVKTSTLDSDIKKMQEKITKQNSSITTYKEQLQKKFSAISQIFFMNTNLSCLLFWN